MQMHYIMSTKKMSQDMNLAALNLAKQIKKEKSTDIL